MRTSVMTYLLAGVAVAGLPAAATAKAPVAGSCATMDQLISTAGTRRL